MTKQKFSLQNTGFDRKSILKRVGIYTAAAIIISAFQCSLFARISPFGATPNLILGLLCAVCLLDKKEAALIFSVGAGFILDSVGNLGISLTPLFFLILSLFLTHFGKKLMPRFIPYIMLLAPAALADSAFTGLRIFFSASSVSVKAILLKIILPGLISTLIFALPLYFLIKLCIYIINAKAKFKI